MPQVECTSMTMKVAALLFALVSSQAAPPRPSFVTPLTPDQMKAQQAVVETTLGSFVMDLLPDLAPNHVGLFIKHVREGA